MENDNSAINQRRKLLNYLTEHGCIITSEARENLDIYHPPARIKELRQDGHQINTVWDNWTSSYGIKHRIAKYVLSIPKPSERLNVSEVA